MRKYLTFILAATVLLGQVKTAGKSEADKVKHLTENTSSIPQEKASNELKADSVSVYATKSPKKTFQSPLMVSKVYFNDLNYRFANGLSDLIGFTSGVSSTNGSRSYAQEITIRGFDYNYNLVLFDGRRQNLRTGHEGSYFFNPYIMNSVEVVK